MHEGKGISLLPICLRKAVSNLAEFPEQGWPVFLDHSKAISTDCNVASSSSKSREAVRGSHIRLLLPTEHREPPLPPTPPGTGSIADRTTRLAVEVQDNHWI